MKKHISLIGLITALALPMFGQTNVPPPSLQSLPSTILGYFSSFDTNCVTWSASRASIYTTAISEKGGVAPLINELGGTYDIWRPTPQTNSTAYTAVFLGVNERNTGVSGTVSSFGGGPGFAVMVYDLRMELSLNGGYNLERKAGQSRVYGEVNFDVMKSLGSASHMAAGVGLFQQFPDNVQGLYAKLNVAF